MECNEAVFSPMTLQWSKAGYGKGFDKLVLAGAFKNLFKHSSTLLPLMVVFRLHISSVNATIEKAAVNPPSNSIFTTCKKNQINKTKVKERSASGWE